MRKPVIYTNQNSDFAKNPFKRLEINVSADDPFEPIRIIDAIIEEHFKDVPKENIHFGFHWRTDGAYQYLQFVFQANLA